MKNIFPCLLISFTLSFCTSNQGSSVPLFNGLMFQLHDGEEVVSLDPEKKEIFSSYFDKKSIQIPLFKCIKSDSTLIFIGIPLNTSIKELAAHPLTHTFDQIDSNSDSTTYLYSVYNSENEQLAIYARNFDGNLLYVLATSNIGEGSEPLFSMEALANRFNQ